MGCDEKVNPSPQPQEITLKDIGLTMENFPKLDGSTTTHPLSVLIATKAFDTNYAWDYQWNSSTSMEEKRIVAQATSLIDISQIQKVLWITDNVKHATTHNAFVNLIEGRSDLVTSARLASEDELALAKEKGVELVSTPIALDAFVIIGNTENDINNLTTNQVKEIYTGDLNYWTQLNGTLDKIRPYQREKNSGSQEAMKTLIMKDANMINAPQMIMMGMGAINVLAHSEEGICYSFYYYTHVMDPIKTIKEFSIDGYAPNQENIATKKYPYTTEVYAITRKDLSEKSTAYKLKEWFLSKEGQKVIEESGYVPIK